MPPRKKLINGYGFSSNLLDHLSGLSGSLQRDRERAQNPAAARVNNTGRLRAEEVLCRGAVNTLLLPPPFFLF